MVNFILIGDRLIWINVPPLTFRLCSTDGFGCSTLNAEPLASVDRRVFGRTPAGAVVSHLNLNICRATNYSREGGNLPARNFNFTGYSRSSLARTGVRNFRTDHP
jgi:hypothetical protein